MFLRNNIIQELYNHEIIEINFIGKSKDYLKYNNLTHCEIGFVVEILQLSNGKSLSVVPA